MSYVFNAFEILEMAEQIERNGAKYYRQAAETTSNEKEKSFLLTLAEMEDAHEITFANLKKQLEESEYKDTAFDPANEAVLYLQALADTKVFKDKELPSTSLEDIYEAAIQTEKDSIAFYLGMKELVPEALGVDKIDEIIKEEMKHIVILTQHKNDLM
jgi:rubrerythrin